MALLFVLLPSLSAAQWNPKPSWKDSYAVDGVCYCDSNGYDHGLDTKTANTPIGVQNVVDICEQIEEVLGEGSTSGRIPYNDIQCGNGPANDAPDEAGCPGRVDIGPDGCDQIGPKWDLEAAYVDYAEPVAPENSLDRTKWAITASHNNSEVNNMIDGSVSSRWTTREKQTSGQWIEIDLSQAKSFNRIELDSSNSANDFPSQYSFYVSNNRSNWGAAIASGSGQAITKINFTTKTARYIRIEQNGSSQNYWWSIHELNIFEMPLDEPPTEPGSIVEWLSGVISTLLMDD
ncbi:MAG: discoidin domain-containing protein [Acidiferrobacterales bacterium]|nr:discoidin domain-containing protein [Acidiferrobacterales bacterium]